MLRNSISDGVPVISTWPTQSTNMYVTVRFSFAYPGQCQRGRFISQTGVHYERDGVNLLRGPMRGVNSASDTNLPETGYGIALWEYRECVGTTGG